MQEDGVPFDRVAQDLDEARRRDFRYSEGQILGSMCTAPDRAAVEAMRTFYETNLGDPAHFPGTAALERAYLDWLLALTHAPTGARALFTSGGTESNIVAVHAARQAWREKVGDPRGRAHIIVPDAAHFSFEKARRLTDMEVRHADVDSHQRVVPASVAALVDDETALIVGIAGTTETGAVDPIAALADIGIESDVPVHVDAALGGFMLPFLPEGGRRPWDFAHAGVSTITMDPHKMGAALIPSGILLARTQEMLSRVAVSTPYVTTESQAGIVGTRPGMAAASSWAVARRLGRHGYAEAATRALELTQHVRMTLDVAGVKTMPGDLNVVLVRCDDPLGVQDALGTRGWRVNAVPRLEGIRLVLMPHVRREHLDAFLPVLLEVLGADATGGPADTRRGEPKVEEAC